MKAATPFLVAALAGAAGVIIAGLLMDQFNFPVLNKARAGFNTGIF